MKRTILLDHIDKLVTEKTYQQAREKERELSPERFTARYSGGSILRWGVIFFGFIALTVLFYFFNGFEILFKVNWNFFSAILKVIGSIYRVNLKHLQKIILVFFSYFII